MLDFIEAAVRARQPDYPPDQSMAGSNTCVVACKPAGYTPGYCVCLHKIAAYERDKAIPSAPICEKEIRDKTCPAMDMQAQEQKAGKALFYVDRQLVREEMDRYYAELEAKNPYRRTATTPKKSLWEGTTVPKTESKPIVAPVKKQEQPAFEQEDGYAAAINAAIKDAATRPEPKVEDPSPSSVKKGMSLLDIARAQMGKS